MIDYAKLRKGAAVSIWLALVAAIFGSVTWGVEYMRCYGFATATDARGARYNWGCYILQDDGRWVPKDYVYGEVQEVRTVQQ